MDAEGTSEWGASGSNGGTVTMTLTNQNIEGDFVVDSISPLSITMVNSTIKGKINNSKVSSTNSITLDSNSATTLTGDSYISSLTNADTTGANINKGSCTFADYNGNNYTGSTSNNTSIDGTIDNENNFTLINKSNFFSISFYLLLMFILIL